MATRSTIKGKAKAKAGAALATVAAGMAISSEASELSPLEIHSALLDAAFKLLEEGQQAALMAGEHDTSPNPFAHQQAQTQTTLDAGELVAQLPTAQAGVHVAAASVETVSDAPSALFAQAETAVQTAAEAATHAASSAASSAAGSAAGSATAAAGTAATGGAAMVAAVPLASAVGIGAGVVGVAAVANNLDRGSDTAGSDLNDIPNIPGLAIDGAKADNIVGKSESKPEVNSANETFSTKAGLIGAKLLDSNLDHLFGS